MNTTKLAQALFPLFTEENPIVFWDDANGKFAGILHELPFENYNVTLINRSDYGDLELKILLELTPHNSPYFLLYSSDPIPAPEKDWLFNIRQYSASFQADIASLLLGELNLANTSMRFHLQNREKFFASHERLEKVKKYIRPDSSEEELDLAILTVLTNADKCSFSSVLLQLIIEQFPANSDNLMGLVSKKWNEIIQYGLENFFWEQTKREFGYIGLKEENGKKQKNIKELTRCLFISDMAQEVNPRLLSSCSHFLPESSYISYSAVFCGDWRTNSRFSPYYTHISRIIAAELNIPSLLMNTTASDLGSCSTFEDMEKAVITDCLKNILQDHFKELPALIQNRQELFWVQWKNEDGLSPYKEVYNGLQAVLEIKTLRAEYCSGFHFAGTQEIFSAYTKKLFKFDQYYRLFYEAAESLSGTFDILKIAKEKIETWITDEYCRNLTIAWEKAFSQEQMLSHWTLPDIPHQKNFYDCFPKPILQSNSSNRAFVIISDGLRYETAEELNRVINGEHRFKSTITSMLAPLPCITRFGMALLLPNTELTFKPGTAEPLVDGSPCSTLEQRNAVLQKYKGMAMKGENLLSYKKESARELIKDCKLIYIYHNEIDSTGDRLATEHQTFSACRKTIDRLRKLVKFIMDNLGCNIFITSDHGFLYQDSPLKNMDKANNKSEEIQETLEAKKRYILGYNLPSWVSAWHGKVQSTTGITDNNTMEFLIPKGTGRFHFAGGAGYVHGGSSLQELVIPVLHVSERYHSSEKKEEITQVNVELLGNNKRVTSNQPVFRFIQMDNVTERCRPRALTVFLSDGSQPVSNEKTIIFNAESGLQEDMNKSAVLLLKNINFDRNKTYYLILRDQEKLTEYSRTEIIIDIAFENLF